jgi:succinate dehydrogenase / fumarate reductase flavoprotein subunit
VFGQRAGAHAAEFAKGHPAATPDTGQASAAAQKALEPFSRSTGEGPYQIQQTLQGTMQELVGIVRREDEMTKALAQITVLATRAAHVAVSGNREYNPGWHTALDLGNLLTVAEAITRSAIERRESRGGHFRDDFPGKDTSFGSFNITVRRGARGEMELSREPIRPMPDALKQVIAEGG